MKFTVQYLGVPKASVKYTSELEAENARSAEVSAKLGLRWAEETHNACCYRVLDETGAVAATGPDAEHIARCRG